MKIEEMKIGMKRIKNKTKKEKKKMKKEETGKELALVPVVTEVSIPSKTLNTVQQKNYKEYGLKILGQMEEKAVEIARYEKSKYLEENEGEIIKEVEKEFPILKEIEKEIAKAADTYDKRRETIRKAQEALNIEKQKLNERIDEETSRGNKKIREVFDKIIEIRKKLEETIDKSEDANEKLETEMLDEMTTDERRDTKELVIRDLYRCETRHFVRGDYIKSRLKEKFEENSKEIERLKAIVREMKNNFEEVMLFDEKKLPEMFKTILNMNRQLTKKYNETVLS